MQTKTRMDYINLVINKVKEYTGFLAILATSLYALGIFITNIYLGKVYGIFNFSLLKSRYIYSGTFFFIYLMFVLGGSIIISEVASIKPVKRMQRFVKAIILLFLFLLTSASQTYCALYIEYEGGFDFRIHSIIIFSVFLWFLFSSLITTFCIWLSKKIDLKQPFAFISIIVMGFVLIVSLYTTSVYKYMSISIGGGKPIPVQLVVNKENKKIIEQYIPMETENITVKVYLIEQNPNSFFIYIDNISQVVEIENSTISAKIYQNKIISSEIISP